MTTINEFVNTFFENRSDKAPYAEYVRFRKAMPKSMNPQEIEALYERFAKHPAYYEKQSFYSAEELEEAKNILFDMLSLLDSEPTSFTDIYQKYQNIHNFRGFFAPSHIPYDNMLRRCFKELAARKMVQCIEVRTCGKVAIRLYWK